MSKTKPRRTDRSKWSQNKVIRGSIISLVILCAYVISMYIPLIGGFTAYPVVVVKCGRLPIVTSDIMGAHVYIEPGMNGYGGGLVLNTVKTLACTSQEAEAKGYHRASF